MEQIDQERIVRTCNCNQANQVPQPSSRRWQSHWVGNAATLETLIFQRMQPFLHRFGIIAALVSQGQFCPPNAPQNAKQTGRP